MPENAKKNWGGRRVGTPILGGQLCRRGWPLLLDAIVQMDKALVSSYRLSVATMPPTEVVWKQFTMQDLLFVVCNKGGHSRLVPQGSSQATLFASSNNFPV